MSDYNPEFWKNAQYSTLWKKHFDNCNMLKNKLIEKFPKLKDSIKEGHAFSDQWLRFKPEDKSGADLIISNPADYNVLVRVDITGSHKIDPSIKCPIWVRPDKIDQAKKQKEPYWFYCVYKSKICAVDVETALKYRDKVKTVIIKKDIPEHYVEIPYNESISEEKFFQKISEYVDKIPSKIYTKQTYFK
ncbi:hypothetical protein GW932_00895 [archaeon]|nr:hypothetical protein [archaeon]